MNTKNVLLGVFVALTLVFASLTLEEYSRVTPTQTLTYTTTATKTVVLTSTSTSTLTTTLSSTSTTTATSTPTATATDRTNGLELRLYSEHFIIFRDGSQREHVRRCLQPIFSHGQCYVRQ